MNRIKIKISGMTCSGCKETVTRALENIEKVIKVTVSLENGSASLETQNNISLKTLQNALPGKYLVQEKTPNNRLIKSKKWPYLKDLYPLFLILFYITISTTIINWNNKSADSFMIDFMGLFFIVFSFFKFLDYSNFPRSFSMYDPLAKFIPTYGGVYPFIETVIGLMLLLRINIILSLGLTIVILGITTMGVIKVLLNKEDIQCACLGTAIKLPMTIATLIENGIMIVMAIITTIILYA